MKTLYILFFISLFTFPLKSVADDELLKPKKERDIFSYVELGGSGNYCSAKLGATVVLKQKHNFSVIGYAHILYANVPDDFEMGGFILWGPSELMEEHYTIDMLYGRIINDTKTKVIRLNLRAGVSLGTFSYPADFAPYEDPDPGMFSFGTDNYTYEYKQKKSIGLVLNPLIELPVSIPFGMSVGGYANINAHRSYARLEVNLMFGKTRSKSVRKHQ